MSQTTIYTCDICGLESHSINDHANIRIAFPSGQATYRDICTECLKKILPDVMK